MRLFFLAFVVSCITTPAVANPVALTNDIFVERVSTNAEGKRKVVLEAPKVVVPGDRLLFVLNYRNGGNKPAEKFVVTNPMPSAVQFAEASDTAAQLSVDGGKSWGVLSALKVRDANGSERPARSEDVTHLRWAFNQPIPVGAAGKLMFRGIVK